jgi:nucleoside-diphosphate-sugar epimerase
MTTSTGAKSVLILGGTSWLGGQVARVALAAGHEVTCLARGTSGEVPAGAQLVRADRSRPDAYAGLPASSRWDLVVDLTRQPGHARGALAALSERADNWVFVSSGSVYADHSVVGDLTTPLLPAFEGDESEPEQYGEAKVACEAAVTAYRGGEALIARSSLIAGRGDRSDRFGYWVGRLALAQEDGQPVVVPETIDQPAQLIDVADVAEWLVSAGLGGTTGIVDAYGARRTLREVIDVAKEVAGFTGEQVPLSDETLLAAGVQEFMGPRSLALWMHAPQWSAFSARSTDSAERAGLRSRDLAETTRAALHTERELGLDRTGRRAGLDRPEELALLAG